MGPVGSESWVKAWNKAPVLKFATGCFRVEHQPAPACEFLNAFSRARFLNRRFFPYKRSLFRACSDEPIGHILYVWRLQHCTGLASNVDLALPM